MPKKWVPTEDEGRYVAGSRPVIPSSVIKSAGRALQVLELFDEARRGLSAIEIATRLNYPKSSTSALLRSLATLGYLHYDYETRTYMPTTRVGLLGSWVNDKLFREGQLLRLLETINERTGQAVLLATRSGLYSKYIYVIQATKQARLHITLGTERSLARSGTGYLILSTYPDEEIAKIARAINAYAPSPDDVVSIADLLAKIANIRQQGSCFHYSLVSDGGAIIGRLLPTAQQGEPLVVAVGGIAAVLESSKNEILAIINEAIGEFIEKSVKETAP